MNKQNKNKKDTSKHETFELCENQSQPKSLGLFVCSLGLGGAHSNSVHNLLANQRGARQDERGHRQSLQLVRVDLLSHVANQLGAHICVQRDGQT